MLSLIRPSGFLKPISNNWETLTKNLHKKFSGLPLNCFPSTNSSLCLRSRLVKETRFAERPNLDHRLMRLFTKSHIGDPMKTIDDPTCQTKSYTGLEAEFYDLLRGKAPKKEVDFYQQLIKEKGGTALELGSGTGRLLLPLLKAGLSVEGIEGSKDMMEICRHEASNQGLKPVLHHSLMHNFKISKTYDTIFAEGGTFMLLTDRNEAFLALKNIKEHLNREGQAIIELFLPLEDIKKPNGTSWNLHKTSVRPKDQAFVFCSGSSKCDVLEQLRTGWTKYEVFKEGRLVQSQLVVSGLRWYSKYEFWLMLEKVGFKSIEMMNLKMREGLDEETTMVFKAIKD